MHQVLFHIPVFKFDVPVFGYGLMLFCAFVACTWMAIRLARRVGVPKEPIQDLSVWLFVTGIVGARIAYVAWEWPKFKDNLWEVFAVWDGGLIFYGSIPGAAVGYLLAYHKQLKKFGVSHWQMADVVAPCLALGLCFGRVGCLLNGCCYGDVACWGAPGIGFPLPSPPRYEMVGRGHEAPAGIIVEPGTTTVLAVEPTSPFAATLKPGDDIVEVEGRKKSHKVRNFAEFERALTTDWERGDNEIKLKVMRAGTPIDLDPVKPITIPLHPTQIYESISMALLLFLLLSYYAYRRYDASLMVIFMAGYAVHRFLDEMLRTDTGVFAFGMTLSQNISLAVFLAAIILALLIWRRPHPVVPLAA